MRSDDDLVDAIERLCGRGYSIEDRARAEALLWALDVIGSDRCPAGATDHDRLADLVDGAGDGTVGVEETTLDVDLDRDD